MGRPQVIQEDEYTVNLADFKPLPNQCKYLKMFKIKQFNHEITVPVSM